MEFALPASGAPAQMPFTAQPVLVVESAPVPPPSRPSLAASDNGGQEIAATPSPRPASRKRAGKTAPTTAKIADEYQAKVFDLMITNVFNALDCAQRLISAKTPTQFVALSTSQACQQWGLIVKQAEELGSIAQRLAASDVRRPTVVEWE
jgi:hypothetical protein